MNSEQTIKEFIPASWFHPVGIFKVLGRFWDRLPDVGGKLFLTFTLDPKNYASEEAAFEDSRDWLRKVFFKLRQGVEHEGKTYVIDAPYCIKVEFHESGWVHYHAIFLTHRFLPKELLAELWGLGWVKVQRITNTDFHYLLKYVTKPADLPAWVPECEDVGKAEQHRHQRDEKGSEQRCVQNDEQNKKQRDAHPDAPDNPPKKTTFQTPCPAFGVGGGVGVREAKFVFGAHGRVGWSWFDGLEVADPDRAVAIEAEDFIEGVDHRRSRGDDCAADDGHLALVNIAAPDGEAAIDDGGDAQHEAEHHDDSETVADAGLEVGGTEPRALGKGGNRVESNQGGNQSE